jgi:hypothetical protein
MDGGTHSKLKIYKINVNIFVGSSLFDKVHFGFKSTYLHCKFVFSNNFRFKEKKFMQHLYENISSYSTSEYLRIFK